MGCNCHNNQTGKNSNVTQNTCHYAEPTSIPWLKCGTVCTVVHCRHPSVKQKPPIRVASGFARYATVGDTLFRAGKVNVEINPDADYINVRSCFCNVKRCTYFQNEH